MSTIESWSGVTGGMAGKIAVSTPWSGTFDIMDLLAVPEAAWADLVARAIEPNAFYHPAWARAVEQHAEGKSGARVLLAWDGPARTRLIGLLPVTSAWRALRLPIPALVAWQAYAPLTTPLIDREMPDVAARALLAAADKAGAAALLLPSLAEDGPAARAMRGAIAEFKSPAWVFNRHQRAQLDARQEGDAAIQTLGAKKIKELRRQRNRLADGGEVVFRIAAPGAETEVALDAFLALEAAGWKGANGTALANKRGDSQFIRNATRELVAAGAAEVATLWCGRSVAAAGVMLRHMRRAFFFKIAYDETAAKTSPGVQLTLDLTRHLCADAGIDEVDSTANSGHPMIDHVWRARLTVCDLLLPVRHGRVGLAPYAAAIAARQMLRETARRVFRLIRPLKGT